MGGEQKAQESEELEAQIQSFLDSGKEIQEVPTGKSGNPNYKVTRGIVIGPQSHICSTNPKKIQASNAWRRPPSKANKIK